MSESEKEALWTFRVKCTDVPRSLPKLLQSLKWNRREEVAQVSNFAFDHAMHISFIY